MLIRKTHSSIMEIPFLIEKSDPIAPNNKKILKKNGSEAHINKIFNKLICTKYLKG